MESQNSTNKVVINLKFLCLVSVTTPETAEVFLCLQIKAYVKSYRNISL